MGTRADFYIGRGEGAEWLGSIAWDGHPESVPEHIRRVDKDVNFREAVAQFLETRDDATKPADGWPWPWDDSRTTDYAYAFDGGKVWASSFGHQWFDSLQPEPEDDEDGAKVPFPDMSAHKAVTLGKRSGLIVFGI